MGETSPASLEAKATFLIDTFSKTNAKREIKTLMIEFVYKNFLETTVVVEISGNLNVESRDYFCNFVSELVESGTTHIVIDCQKLGVVSSSGLASLLVARKKAIKNGANISLTHLNSNIARVLEISKLGRLLSIYPTTELALKNDKDGLACFG